jgi:anti-anti-sigma factor
LDDEFDLDASIAEPGTLLLRVTGELDTASADLLPAAVVDRAEAVSRCIVDLSACSFIDSSGIRGLLLCQRELGGDGALELIGVSARLERTLRIAGVHEVLHISPAPD